MAWKNKAAAAVVLSLVLGCPGAKAYVLPGPSVLDRFLQQFGREKALLIRQEVHVQIDAKSRDAAVVHETVRYAFPARFRSDAVSKGVERVHLHVDGESVTVLDQAIDPVARDRFNRYKDLILYRERGQLERLLARHGIDADVCTLGRFQDSVAYVIGARYPDASASQLLIDKETFWPVRWLFVEGKEPPAATTLEIRYLGWAKEGPAWYPRRMEFYQNGVLAKVIEVQEVQVDPVFPKDLFDPARLRSTYAPARQPDAGAGKGDAEPDEIQKTIEEFKKIYE